MNAPRHPLPRKLRLAGTDMTVTPFMSPLGRLYRLSRANGLSSAHFRHVLGVSNRICIDLRHGQLNWDESGPWDTALSSTESPDSRPLGMHYWLPYRCHQTRRYAALRGCLECLALGYHSPLHQLPWINQCPWHRSPITDTCQCGRPLLPTRTDGMPYRLLQCSCGHDHFDLRRAIAGFSKIDSLTISTISVGHLRRTDEERERNYLYYGGPNEGSIAPDQAYAMATGLCRTPPSARRFTLSDEDATIARREPGLSRDKENTLEDDTMSTAAVLGAWWNAAANLPHTDRPDYLPVRRESRGFEVVAEHTNLVIKALQPKWEHIDLDVTSNHIKSEYHIFVIRGPQGDDLVSSNGISADHLAVAARLMRKVATDVWADLGMPLPAPEDTPDFLRIAETPQGRLLAACLSEIAIGACVDSIRCWVDGQPLVTAGDLLYARSTFAPYGDLIVLWSKRSFQFTFLPNRRPRVRGLGPDYLSLWLPRK